jgi:hypothetical protein
MLKRDIVTKLGGVSISIALVLLVLLVLIPPTGAVFIDPGTPSSSSVTNGASITFHNVNLTIRSAEKIPIDYLNFTVFRSSDDESVAWVNFSVDGTETGEYPSGKFSVTRTTDINNDWYGYGYLSGEDEKDDEHYYFGYGYGYGYGGESDATDITILYDITYITHSTGTFYAKFFVDSTTHIYVSNESTSFRVNTAGGGGTSTNPLPIADAGGPYSGYINQAVAFNGANSTKTGGAIVGYRWDWTNDGTYDTGWLTSATATHVYTSAGVYQVKLQVKDNENSNAEDTALVTIVAYQGFTASQHLLDVLETEYDIHLISPFYANDTNNDGVLDSFTDPNHVLTEIHFVTLNGDQVVLLSADEDAFPEFFWSPALNIVTPIQYSAGNIINVVDDGDLKTKTVTISIEKENWMYIETIDVYPDNPDLIVKTVDDRMISSQMIWRVNSKVYIFDDPAANYFLIYSFSGKGSLFDVNVLLTKDSVTADEGNIALITLINVGEPGTVNGTVQYALSKDGQVVWTAEEAVSVLGQTSYNKTIATRNLAPGTYTYIVTYSYGLNQTASSQQNFVVKAPAEGFPVIWIGVILLVILIGVILAFVWKKGMI